ncbi:DinB family protein [Nocardioides sp. NPDC006303]|uniref:DinB family protein n=1 Tax=Nocardioides sp. NPDC006303 TaxID=3156747 RepID=UPI0033BEA93F
MATDPKTTLKTYIDARREALISKVEGLSEREARLPRTPTGTNLLGIIKHVTGVEAVYLGATFGRPFPHPGELISEEQWDIDPQADWYATEDETIEGIIDLYRRVIAHGDETIEALSLDAIGHVPHWGNEEVTLHQMLVHLFADLAGHGGQADILREDADGAVGWRKSGDNIPPEYDWTAYVAKLTDIANKF